MGVTRFFRGLAWGGATGIAAAILIDLATLAAGGPIGLLSGGVLRGDIALESRPDLDLIESEQGVAIQVQSERPRSVATRMVVHAGELYVPVEFAFPFVRWEQEVAQDERVVLRVRGLLYRARAVRVTAPQLEAELRELVAKKYRTDQREPESADELGFFWIDFPRAATAQLLPVTNR